MLEIVELYVELADEGTTVFRPAKAYRLDPKFLVLSNEGHDFETEIWSVLPGTLITVEQKHTTNGAIDVAQKYDEFVQ